MGTGKKPSSHVLGVLIFQDPAELASSQERLLNACHLDDIRPLPPHEASRSHDPVSRRTSQWRGGPASCADAHRISSLFWLSGTVSDATLTADLAANLASSTADLTANFAPAAAAADPAHLATDLAAPSAHLLVGFSGPASHNQIRAGALHISLCAIESRIATSRAALGQRFMAANGRRVVGMGFYRR